MKLNNFKKNTCKMYILLRNVICTVLEKKIKKYQGKKN